MSAVREKIIHLLGNGVSQAVVAEAVSVSPSYVSQLLEEAGVREEVAKIRAGRIEEAISGDQDINVAEKQALSRMVKQLPFMKAGETIKAFQVLNGARRKAEESGLGAAVAPVDMVTVVLPKAARIFIEINGENQVTSVEGQTMATLPSRALPGLQRQLEESRKERNEATVVEALPSLPSGMVSKSNSIPPTVPATPRPAPHVTAYKERMEQRDRARATHRLENLSVVGPDGKMLEI